MSTRSASAENVIAGWLGRPIPYSRNPKPRNQSRAGYRKHSARRIREAEVRRLNAETRARSGAPV